jgi:putative nucleotidyltransferase with HDIG domain
MSSPPDAPAGERPRDRFRDVFNQLARRCDLPPCPKVASRALALAADPQASLDAVARVVAGDAAFAARVLRLARSMTYVRQTPPRTIQETIATIGLDRLRAMLVAAAARGLYRTPGGVTERLWEHALATALAADALAAPGEPRGGAAFIAGLLHDVGKVVFLLADPARFASLGHADDAAERAAFGATHAMTGALLADLWGLELEICNAILEHHAPDPGALAARIAIADWIAYRVADPPVDVPPPRAVRDAAAYDDVIARVATAFHAERRFFE